MLALLRTFDTVDPAQPGAIGFCLGGKCGLAWHLHAYGNTLHAFTVPGLDVPELGLAHQPDADRSSWQTMRGFFRELFG
ncbi:uncharacterized protein STAUR_1664 [Stigmatella aurantiaca DW4/3-1]|nr:uncharacterized protein STAUR_1664 [Stigmatella aurantiaca DW4/3-1]